MPSAPRNTGWSRTVSERLAPKVAPLFPQGVAAELKRFYYDTAQAANPAAMSALTKIVPTAQIVLGTDYPFPWVSHPVEHVLKTPGLPGAERAAQRRGPAASASWRSSPVIRPDPPFPRQGG